LSCANSPVNTLGKVVTHCENLNLWRRNCSGNRGTLGGTGIGQRLVSGLVPNCPFLSLLWQSSNIPVVVLCGTMKSAQHNRHHRGRRRNPRHLGRVRYCSSRRCCLCNRPRFSNSDWCRLMNLRWVGPILLGKQRMMYWHFDLERFLSNNYDNDHRCCC
jgi:hypothetical protein